MKFEFKKIKKNQKPEIVEIKEPVETTEEKLEKALDEIDFLTNQLRLPLQESKNAFKKRHKKLESDYKTQWDNYLKEFSALCDEANAKVDEAKAIIAEYEDKQREVNYILQDVDAEIESRRKEIEDIYNQRMAEIEVKLQEAKNKSEKELAEAEKIRENAQKKAEQIIKDAQIKADNVLEERNGIIEQANNERDEIINNAKNEKQQALKERDKILRKANQKSEDIILNAEREVKKAQKEKDRIIEEANTKSDKILQDAEEKMRICDEEISKKHEDTDREIQEYKDRVKNELESTEDIIEKNIEKIEELNKDITEKTKTDKALNKKLFKKIGYISLAVVIILSIILTGFRFYLFPAGYIGSGISKTVSQKAFEISANAVITVDGTTITRMSLFDGSNQNRNEEYTVFKINDEINSFEWERYNKGNAEFIKSPYEPQYVLAENRNDAGWYYDSEASRDLIISIMNHVLSNMKVEDTNIVSEYNSDNFFNNFGKFIKNQFIPDSLTYSIELPKDNIKDVYGILVASKIYQEFFEEERVLQEKLNLDDTVGTIDAMLASLFVNSNINNAIGSIYIDNGRVNSITLNFIGTNASGQNIGIYTSINLTETEKETTYEKNKFMMNSMNYTEVYPRIEQDEFTELESQGTIVENITTVEDLENNGYDIEGFGDKSE